MPRTSSTKGKNQEHRELLRTYIALNLFDGGLISSQTLKEKYYQELSDESFHKTFKRDREALEKEGVYLSCEKEGSSKRWRLEKEQTLADIKKIDPIERRCAAILLKAAQTNPEFPQKNTLGAAIARIGQINAGGISQLESLPPDCPPEVLSTIQTCLQAHTPVKISYKSLSDKKLTERTLKPYGLFSLGRIIYVVGLRTREGAEDAIRTFNLSRINKAKPLTKEPVFDIPKDFKVSDYRILPFEIGDEDPQLIRLFVEESQFSDVSIAVRKRGSFTRVEEGYIWQGNVRNSSVAAAWCIENDVIPLEPSGLVDAWASVLKEALDEN